MKDESLEMARQIGIPNHVAEYYKDELATFAKLVVAKEREACAFLCDELWRKGGWDFNAGYAATKIRARGDKA